MLNKNQIESIAKHLRELAQIFESANKQAITTNAVVEEDEQNGSKRGRKPGAVSDEIRCQHTSDKGRCKNRATKGTVCGKHLSE